MDSDNVNESNPFKSIFSYQEYSTNDEIKISLKKLITQGKDYELDMVDPLMSLLEKDDIELLALTCELIAELAKCDRKRPRLAHQGIVKSLLAFLDQNLDNNTANLIKQTCRALGNLCCDCNAGRDLIVTLHGLPIVVDILPKVLQEQNASSNELSEIRLCACKCLLNFVIGGLDYVKPTINTNLIAHLHKIIKMELQKDDMNDEIISNSLLILSVINENIPDYVFEEDLNLAVLKILQETKNIEISEMCLEHLHLQADHDSVKTYLAKAGAVQLLHSKLEMLSIGGASGIIDLDDEEVKALLKLACDLIILILTGDDAMNYLYENGTGEVYNSMVKWIDSDDKDLLTTAVFALGNFARCDSYCVQMMERGVFDKLLDLYESVLEAAFQSIEGSEDEKCMEASSSIRLQHAILSAIRNLCVPTANKLLAAQKGRVTPLMIGTLPKVKHHLVAYKLLATIRMLVDGQEEVAAMLVNNREALEACGAWGARVEYAGVAGEAPRLLARTLRQLQHTKQWMPLLEGKGCISCIVNMLVSPHIVMQNEAILALTVLTAGCLMRNDDPDDGAEKLTVNENTDDEHISIQTKLEKLLTKHLIDSEIGKHMSVLIERSCTKMPVEVVENLSKCLTIMIGSIEIAQNFKSAKLNEFLNSLIDHRTDFPAELMSCMKTLITSISFVNTNSTKPEVET